MKLSTLLAYQELLNGYNHRNTNITVNQQLGPIEYTIDNHELQFPELKQQLNESRQRIDQSLDDFNQTIQQLKQQVQAHVNSLEPTYHENSRRLYYEEMLPYDTDEVVLNRTLNLNNEAIEYLSSRINLNSNWKHAGMIIRPGNEEWIENLVGLDPLYIVDDRYSLLAPAMDRFNPKYQSRLRNYQLTEGQQLDPLQDLPKNQFSFVLAYNFFHYRPIEVLEKYLESIFDRLTAGGILAMTFNDCDRSGAVSNCERNFMCYTPGKTVLATARRLGFKLSQQYNVDAAVTWLELIKPGKLVSLRGGQTLARLIPKPTNTNDNTHQEIVDNAIQGLYTNKQYHKLCKRAAKLGLDDPESYTPEQLESYINERTTNEGLST
jgi:hypothetical protein